MTWRLDQVACRETLDHPRVSPAAAVTSTDNRPFNDDFATRAVLSGSNVRVRSSNVGATVESGETAPVSGTTGGHSLWWTWTSPAATVVAFDTIGTSTVCRDCGFAA